MIAGMDFSAGRLTRALGVGGMALYALGYFVYLGAAGLYAWPHMHALAWFEYLTWQVFYGLLWPAWLIL